MLTKVTRHSLTISEFGAIDLRFTTYVVEDDRELSPISNHRIAFEPGATLPATVTIPDVGEVPMPQAVRDHAGLAWTPAVIAAFRARRDAVAPRR